jgi:hypothetical protein
MPYVSYVPSQVYSAYLVYSLLNKGGESLLYIPELLEIKRVTENDYCRFPVRARPAVTWLGWLLAYVQGVLLPKATLYSVFQSLL